jgi:nucleoside 2-deoxyribosyltransferase
MKIFFAGIIQGSSLNKDIHSQDYRSRIKSLLLDTYPDIEIFDPFENHRNSVDYDNKTAEVTFHKHLEEIEKSDLLLAFLPEASMGTAIEIWAAYSRRIPVLTISPMTTNWVIRLFADKNFETIEAFGRFIQENDLRNLKFARRKEPGNIKEST